MNVLIEAKVRYDKMLENGTVKRVNESYIVKALSMTQAEARVTEEMKAYISGEYTVSATKETNYAEIFRSEGDDYWYKVKINIITLDEKSGTEKATPLNYLVQAHDFKGALNNFLKAMKDTTCDYDIVSIAETKIMDVFDTK